MYLGYLCVLLNSYNIIYIYLNMIYSVKLVCFNFYKYFLYIRYFYKINPLTFITFLIVFKLKEFICDNCMLNIYNSITSFFKYENDIKLKLYLNLNILHYVFLITSGFVIYVNLLLGIVRGRGYGS